MYIYIYIYTYIYIPLGGRGAGFIGRPLGSANIVDPVAAANWLDAYWVFPAICRGQDGCFKGPLRAAAVACRGPPLGLGFRPIPSCWPTGWMLAGRWP